MEKCHSTQLAMFAFAAALGTAINTAHPAQAATVKYQFQATLTESIFLTGVPEIGLEANPDFYKGIFSFDDASLTGIGFESLGADADLQVSLIEDPRVDQALDPRFPEFPTVNFQDGELLGLDWFAVYHPFTNVPELDYPGDFVRISGTELTDGFDPTFYTPEEEPRSPVLGFGTVEYSAVPEPETILGLLATVFGSSWMTKKKNTLST